MKMLSAKETKQLIGRETARVRAMAKLYGLTLHKAKRGFCFGYELRNADGQRVYGDDAWGFNRTLPQCERFLEDLEKALSVRADRR